MFRRLFVLLSVSLLLLLARFAGAEEVGSADLNGDGVVDTTDFALFVAQFGLVDGDAGFVEDLKARDILPILQKLENDLKAFNYLHLHRIIMGNAPVKFVGGHLGIRGTSLSYLDLEVHKSDLKRFLHEGARNAENGHDYYAYFVTELMIPELGEIPVVSHFATHVPYPAGGPRPDTLSFKLLIDPIYDSDLKKIEEVLFSANNDNRLHISFIAIHK